MNELEKKFIEHFNEPYNIQLRERVPFLLVSLAHELAAIAEKFYVGEVLEKIKFEEENTKLKKQLAITKEKIIKVLKDYYFEDKEDIKLFEQMAKEILGDDN